LHVLEVRDTIFALVSIISRRLTVSRPCMSYRSLPDPESALRREICRQTGADAWPRHQWPHRCLCRVSPMTFSPVPARFGP